MNRFFKFSGILLWISAVIFGFYYLYTNFTEVSDTIFKWAGIISLILLLGFGLIRLMFGKRWFIETPKSFLIGSDLIKATENTLNELPQPSKSTLANLIGHLIYRFTRIGIFAFIIAMVPIGILTIQTVLLSTQNEKIDRQNVRLDQQTALLEADRRSSVIFESGNILDAVARELDQKRPLGDSSLSDPLIGRIIALSRAMKEYRYLEPKTDRLTRKALSPERGHLLLALHNSKLDSSTYVKINKGANYSKADLSYANLAGANLQFADLREADLDFADFQYSNLQFADLTKASLYNADLKGSKLNYVYLESADLRRANLAGVDFSAFLLQKEFQAFNLIDIENSISSGASDKVLTTFVELIVGSGRGKPTDKSNLLGVDFSDANLNNTNFSGAELQVANFSNARINGSNFSFTTVPGASFKGAKLDSSIMLNIIQSSYIKDFKDAKLKGVIAFKLRKREFLKAGADTTGMIWLDEEK